MTDYVAVANECSDAINAVMHGGDPAVDAHSLLPDSAHRDLEHEAAVATFLARTIVGIEELRDPGHRDLCVFEVIPLDPSICHREDESKRNAVAMVAAVWNGDEAGFTVWEASLSLLEKRHAVAELILMATVAVFENATGEDFGLFDRRDRA